MNPSLTMLHIFFLLIPCKIIQIFWSVSSIYYDANCFLKISDSPQFDPILGRHKHICTVEVKISVSSAKQSNNYFAQNYGLLSNLSRNSSLRWEKYSYFCELWIIKKKRVFLNFLYFHSNIACDYNSANNISCIKCPKKIKLLESCDHQGLISEVFCIHWINMFEQMTKLL